MTIEKGSSWGEPGSRSEDAPVASSDAELAVLAAAAHGCGDQLQVGVAKGDVLATVGLLAGREAHEQFRYSFDLGFASLDGADPIPFVAHACVHRPLWRGEFAVIMNVGWLGDWYLGPRAHPNDGLLDVTIGHLPWRQRLLARTRLRVGTHLPHPQLQTLRRSQWQHEFSRPVPVFLDGQPKGRHRTIEVSIQPDCFTLIV